jgi:CBS domain-containing protein
MTARRTSGSAISRSARRLKPVTRARARGVSARRGGVLRARDLMTRTPVTVPADMKVGELCDLLQVKNINGAPVVDENGRLVGVVTQEDIIYGAMGHPTPEDGDFRSAGVSAEGADIVIGRKAGRPSKRVVAMLRGRHLQEAPPARPRRGEKPFWAEHRAPDPMEMPVSTIMTSPAISAEEDTLVMDLCRIMWSLRIHRVPILKKEKVTGLVSSMDLCRAVLEGKIKI